VDVDPAARDYSVVAAPVIHINHTPNGPVILDHVDRSRIMMIMPPIVIVVVVMPVMVVMLRLSGRDESHGHRSQEQFKE